MKEPLLWISEGGKSSVVARRRLANLRIQEEKWHPMLYLVVIPQIFSDTESRNTCIKRLLLAKLTWGSRLAPRDDSLVLITQDDVQLCGHFVPELTRLLDGAPKDWRTLHLCVGYLWGRMQNKPRLDRELPPVVPADPEWIVPKWTAQGDRLAHLFEPAWVGGPLAFLIRKRNIENLLMELRATSMSTPDDLTLVWIATRNDYMVRKDLLCHEREQGGAQNTTGALPRTFAAILAAVCCIAIYTATTTRLTLNSKLRAFIFLVVFVCLLFYVVKTVTPQNTPEIVASYPSTDATPTRHFFIEQCANVKLAQCVGCGVCAALSDPEDAGRWLASIEQLLDEGGCMRVSSTLHTFDASTYRNLDRTDKVGLAFCAASLAEPAERFSLLPCFVAPKHIALQRLYSLAKCAIANGAQEQNYLISLPESVLCECLTGERRLPSTEPLRKECLEAIKAHGECCAVY
uniref:Uncharacterized protein n=1 Tax=viral metagenome TaxID=1070528 RepID=A0A6C0C0T2_9ZZZZ